MHGPLNLAYFFNGTMRKEEVASGIAAMLFDSRVDFREALYRKAGWSDASALASHDWQTEVEVTMPGAGFGEATLAEGGDSHSIVLGASIRQSS